MNVGSLFSGCRGLDLGLEAAGHETLWHVENDPACQRIIARHCPGLPLVDDVRDLAAIGQLEPVEVLAGGFPCQDLSYAGKGAGLDGERSGLWYAYARCVRLLRPRYVVVENVPGLATRGLGRVLHDLAEAGYMGQWLRLRAADLGAPHGRERIFIVAADADRERSEQRRQSAPGEESRRGSLDRPARRDRTSSGGALDASPLGSTATDADDGPRERERPRPQPRRRGADTTADTDRDGRPRIARSPARRVALHADERRHADRCRPPIEWGSYGPAVRRWERALGRAAPIPVDERSRLSPPFVEWMLGFPDGYTEGEKRTARLRMLGNAVQVQCGAAVGAKLEGMANDG